MTTTHPFPVTEPDAAGGARAGFFLLEETGLRDRRFRFALPLPEGWARRGEAGRAPSTESPHEILACFAPPGEPEAEMVVTGRLLAREVAPADLLLSEVERSGEERLRHREVDSEDGRTIDVLTRRRTENGVLVLRRSVMKRGRRMLVLTAAAKEERWARWAAPLAASAAGLRFLEPGSFRCAEPLGTLSRKEPDDFLLFHPASWALGEPVAARPGVVSARLVNGAGEQAVGRLDLAVVARAVRPGPRELVDECVAKLAAGGLEAPPVPLRPATAPAAFRRAWEGVVEATSGEARLELRFAIGERPAAWYCFALTGPARAAAPEAWALNRRALEIAFGLVATPDVPMRGWIAEEIGKGR